MKNGLIHFLKVIIILFAIGILFALIKFPPSEGRAANLDFVSIYMDPLIIYGYIAFVPFFVGLFQAFKLLGYAEKNKLSSKASLIALRNIKYSSIIFSGFIILGVLYIRLFAHGDDPAGPSMLGALTVLTSLSIAALAHYSERKLK